MENFIIVPKILVHHTIHTSILQIYYIHILHFSKNSLVLEQFSIQYFESYKYSQITTIYIKELEIEDDANKTKKRFRP